MINFILEQLSGRYINDKGKRMLLLTSLYVLIMHMHGKEPNLEKFNQELKLVHDIKGVNLATLIYPVIWSDRFKHFVQKAPSEKVIRYVSLRLPKWLDYRESDDYSLESDLKTLEGILPK
ncbi:hypothetical protein [Serratia phage PCH45]|uniref:hypothetical protein n=1 Tax=Serratia phage PCH45 TaxID=2608368 RepID=UPI0012A97174|nr:hypothetical protein [Serratia phage PCH45]